MHEMEGCICSYILQHPPGRPVTPRRTKFRCLGRSAAGLPSSRTAPSRSSRLAGLVFARSHAVMPTTTTSSADIIHRPPTPVVITSAPWSMLSCTPTTLTVTGVSWKWPSASIRCEHKTIKPVYWPKLTKKTTQNQTKNTNSICSLAWVIDWLILWSLLCLFQFWFLVEKIENSQQCLFYKN